MDTFLCFLGLLALVFGSAACLVAAIMGISGLHQMNERTKTILQILEEE